MDWWIDEAIVLSSTDPRKLGGVSKKLREKSGAKGGFSKTMLSRVIRREAKITLEFTEAVCKLYDLPEPIFLPRSKEEALVLAREASKYPDEDPARDAAHRVYIERLRQQRGQPANLETVRETEERLARQAKRAVARRSK